MVIAAITYTYGVSNWKDKMAAYNGTPISYDAIGNPLNDGNWNYTWTCGRQLRALSKGSFGEPGFDSLTFSYNADGLRTRKTRMYFSNGDIAYSNTEYTLHGKNIVHLTQGGNNLHFFYDASSKPAVVDFNGVKYGYIVNLQGDVLGLIDGSGNEVVRYTYDAWGKVLSTTGSLAATLGAVQPFRYRGYVYDVETGLYYLRSRYYNPNRDRFINADTEIRGNVFSYCENNPASMLDSDGFAPSHATRVLIHNAVCWDVCKSFPDIMFCRYGMKVEFDPPIDGKTYGFIDILDLYQGEVYEVKRVGLSHDNAVVQLKHYVEGTLVGLKKLLGEKMDTIIPDLVLRPGTNRHIKGQFVYGNYSVSYWFARDGIIEYDYDELSSQPESQPITIRKKQRQTVLKESVNWGKALGTTCLALLAGGAMGAMVKCLSDDSYLY